MSTDVSNIILYGSTITEKEYKSNREFIEQYEEGINNNIFIISDMNGDYYFIGKVLIEFDPYLDTLDKNSFSLTKLLTKKEKDNIQKEIREKFPFKNLSFDLYFINHWS